MNLSAVLQGLAEVQDAIAADRQGALVEASPGLDRAEELAATAAVAARELTEAGDALGLGELELLLVKGSHSSSATALRPDGLLRVSLDPTRGSRPAELALRSWARPGAAPAGAEAAPTPVPAALPPPPPDLPAPRAEPSAPAAADPAGAPDPWAAVRRALVRGQLTEGVAASQAIGAADGGRPDGEPVNAAEREHAIQVLLEGIGSVLAGDGVAGERILRALADPAQPNPSFRWLALHWSARAALRRGGFPAARAHVKESLELGRQLDLEARAVSQWTAAMVLSHDSDPTRALAWLAEARARFLRLGDAWGVGQTWLTEARVLAALKREEEALEAGRRAAAQDPGWDEPPVFLARRALLREDLAGARALLASVQTHAADRVRALVDAIEAGLIGRADAGEYLREADAPPTQRGVRTLGRIAESWPRFVQAREALAWMLLKAGRHGDAAPLFRALLAEPLSPADRASVMLGLGCVTNAGSSGSATTPSQPPASLATAAPAPLAAMASPAPPPAAASTPGLSSGATAPVQPLVEAVFSGQLGVFALPDLLEFLRSARRTGRLVCSGPCGIGRLQLREGRITEAVSPAAPDVGELLVRSGRLSAEALRAAAGASGAADGEAALAQALVGRGLVQAPAVREAREQRIALAIRELLGWREGEFAFDRHAGSAPVAPELAVSVDPQEVLLAAFKDQDEAAATPMHVDVEH